MRFYQAEKNRTFSAPKNKKRKWPFFLAGFIFLLVLGGGIYFINSDFFRIEKIQVNGLAEYESENLKTSLENFFVKNSKISSALGAENILSWREDVGDFLEENPSFKSLAIEKKYFKKEITIQAQERGKYGIWCHFFLENVDLNKIVEAENENLETAEYPAINNSPEGTRRCWWFDEEGIIFKETAAVESELFNRVNDFSGRNLSAGDEIMPARLFENLKAIFSILEKIDLNAKTVNLDDLSIEEVYIESISDPKVIFSLRHNPSFILGAVEALKKDGRWKKVLYVDFRVENKVYYKMK